MLGLTQQVRRHIDRICRVIRDDQDLGRACDHVYVDRTERELFAAATKALPGPTILSTCGMKPAP